MATDENHSKNPYKQKEENIYHVLEGPTPIEDNMWSSDDYSILETQYYTNINYMYYKTNVLQLTIRLYITYIMVHDCSR